MCNMDAATLRRPPVSNVGDRAMGMSYIMSCSPKVRALDITRGMLHVCYTYAAPMRMPVACTLHVRCTYQQGNSFSILVDGSIQRRGRRKDCACGIVNPRGRQDDEHVWHRILQSQAFGLHMITAVPKSMAVREPNWHKYGIIICEQNTILVRTVR